MSDNWQAVEGTGWLTLPGYCRLNPRRDNVGGGRQYFTAILENGEHARATGDSLTGGPETWEFEFDVPFWLADRDDRCFEVVISLLEGGRYAAKYHPGDWPRPASDGPW